MMDSGRIGDYVDRVYGYAVKQTYSREEADELSQEILFTAVRELPKLKDDGKFEPWLWGIARNVTKSYRRHMGKQRAMYFYDVPGDLVYEEADDDAEELYALLREKIAMLSAAYRDIIIFYYYDGLSTKEISERMKIPEGTVTWRLAEGRRKLKKECTEMEETALKPIRMHLDIYGSGNYHDQGAPFPSVYIDDALSQNILFYCYETARGVEELSKLCGTPAYYIEERMANLLRRSAVIEVSKGKYRTDFIIWDDRHCIYGEENAEKTLMPIMDRMIEALQNVTQEMAAVPFYRAEKSDAELFFLYGVLAFEYFSFSPRYCKLPIPEIPVQYDGNRWRYIGNMETGAHRRVSIGVQVSGNDGYLHQTYACLNGFSWRGMMPSPQIGACADILKTGRAEDLDAAAQAIRDGYITKREDGSLFVTVPVFDKDQISAFYQIAQKHLSPLAEEYAALVDRYVDGYRKLFPKHLKDDADRMCHRMFMDLYQVIAAYALKTGAVKLPRTDGYCDVMIGSR